MYMSSQHIIPFPITMHDAYISKYTMSLQKLTIVVVNTQVNMECK